MAAHMERSTYSEETRVSEETSELFHYTTISALTGILETNTLWATRASHLNDLSELELAWPRIAERFVKHYEEELVVHLQRNPSDSERIASMGGVAQIAELDGSMMVKLMRSKLLGDNTTSGIGPPFLVSFTTHQGSSDQDVYHRNHGMLSQWRGYGGEDGVALVFDTKEIEEFLEREGQRFHYWPCFIADAIYDEKDLNLVDRFPKFFGELKNYVGRLIQGDDEAALQTLISRVTPELPSVVGRLKHISFQEEREFRIVIGATPESLRDTFVETGESPDKAFKPVHHRLGLCGPVPYIRLFEGCGEDLPVVRIIVGPSRNQVAHLETVRDLVGTRKIKVQLSETPYVGPA